MIPRDELTNQKLLLLTEGRLDVFRAKTACSVLRYRRDDVVALIDSQAAGQSTSRILGFGDDVPILASVGEALKLSPRPTALLIGIAPSGGRLPETMRHHLLDALAAGLHVISGLHTPLNDDAELAPLARRNDVHIYDIRQVPDNLPIARARAVTFPVTRVLTVGSDCNIGKMVCAIELSAEMTRRGYRSAFVPTGQTGILIAGWGLAIDRTISDFTAGASEWLVEQVRDFDFAFVEGQGALDHASFSGVTMAQVHGTVPDYLVVCHQPGRSVHSSAPTPIKPLGQVIEIAESVASWVRTDHVPKVVAVGLNTHGMTPEAATNAIEATRQETGLAVFDPIRTGCAEPADRLIELAGKRT